MQGRIRQPNHHLTLILASIAWFALAGQMALALLGRWNNDASLLGGLINFFSYFTVTTNTLVAMVLTSALQRSDSRLSRYFRQPSVISGVAVSIVVVGVSYTLLLRNVWNPQGFQWLVNELLHDVMPIAFVVWWWLSVPSSALRWRHAWLWALYPLVYFGYAMLRGHVIGVYQYPFIDVSKLGFERVLINSLVILAGFVGLSLGVIALDRRRGE
ncbi:Pr6Pr family membrane protein [Pseudomonas sp. dw_358]|uniref:Pr6Pr family membrane protein n=1 Tax=Pseudomonas sp. dw_358 TaxID=2720083 RepID=UPI001BD602F9|nr:Pr6Pr family membrane protein [Pseudomonas sp. dw_358]